MSSVIRVLLIAALAAIVSPAFVQAQGRAGRGLEGRGAAPDVIALQDLFDSYVLMQSQQRLQLTPEQAPQFITRLRELQLARRRATMQRIKAVQELGRLTAAARDEGQDAQIRQRLQDLDAAQGQSSSDIKQALANLDQVLTVLQQARFRVLEEQLERNKLDLLMQARRGRSRF